ncbi:MAG: MBL fold metallo-hydrolase, partial [Gammaproteobacteria bacterium]|nr:MBL fold metallo-hydrolase [Gammaproteobacteria bacterium]
MSTSSTRSRLRPDLEYPYATPAIGEFVEVAPQVQWLRLPLPMALDHINVWLLDDGDGWTLVDTGLDVPLVRDTWLRLVERELVGRKIHRIIVTHHHPDHIGLADWLHRETGAPVWMSAAELAACKRWACPPDDAERRRLTDFFESHGAEDGNDMFGPDGLGGYGNVVSGVPDVARFLEHDDSLSAAGTDWRVMICGGHAPAHAVLWSEERDLLITGDQVLPRISSNVSVLGED